MWFFDLHFRFKNLISAAKMVANNLQRELPSSRAAAVVQLLVWLCSEMSLPVQAPSLLDK
jgi:hypothetical protein